MLILAYDDTSESAILLAKALHIPLLPSRTGIIVINRRATIINWGSTKLEFYNTQPVIIINHPSSVFIASHKLYAFRELTRNKVRVLPLIEDIAKRRFDREFRVHVFRGSIIDFTEKKQRCGQEVNPCVQTHDNNWVFTRENVILPDDVAYQAREAILALGLDFGAVDVGYVESENKAYVLWVNTAPEIEGTTLQRYVEAFRLL